MARKKKAEEPGAGAPWLNTFADLMNLLLCFFVLLFASSTVDAEKYEQIVASITNSFSIFNSGSTAIDEGKLISAGVSQLNDFDDYYHTMGRSSEDTDEEEYNQSEAMKELQEKNKEATEAMYDKVSDLTSQKKLEDYVNISIDKDFKYIEISLSGSILFDSGKAELKKDALPIFSKVGDILKLYDDYKIEIEGHTDNVPIHNSTFKNNNWLSSARALNAATYLMTEKGMDPKTLSWTGRGEYNPVANNATPEGRAKNRRVEIRIYNNINN